MKVIPGDDLQVACTVKDRAGCFDSIQHVGAKWSFLLSQADQSSPVTETVLPPVCVKINRVMLTARRCASTSRVPDISVIADLIPSDRDRHTACVNHSETKPLCQAMKQVSASQSRALVSGKMSSAEKSNVKLNFERSDQFCSAWCAAERLSVGSFFFHTACFILLILPLSS